MTINEIQTVLNVVLQKISVYESQPFLFGNEVTELHDLKRKVEWLKKILDAEEQPPVTENKEIVFCYQCRYWLGDTKRCAKFLQTMGYSDFCSKGERKE